MSIKFLIFLLSVFAGLFIDVRFGVFCVFVGMIWISFYEDITLKYILIVGVVLFRVVLWINDSDILVLGDNGLSYNVTGVVCMEPDIRRDDVRYGICLSEIDSKGMLGRFLWKNNKLNLYEIGDRLEMNCVFEVPFEENGFSYKNYLKIFKIDLICDGYVKDYIEGGFSLKKIILRVKNWMIDFFDFYLLEPASSLMNGILFGSRRGFAADIMDKFSRTGLTHIIAVSGYNVALIILVVEYLTWWIPRGKRFYLICLSLIVFAFLTGLSASVVRACIMGGLTLWGLRAGQNVNFWKVLLFCIVIMGIWNPAFIYYDVSFHLSILATLGVVIGGKFVKIEADKDFVGLKEAFYMTVFAQIFTTPLVIMKFDYLSVVSPLANVLVAPLLPILMFLGSFLVLLEFLLPFKFFSYLIVLIIEILSRVFFKIVSWMSEFDFLVIDLESINRELWVGIYVLSFVIVLVFLSKKNLN